MPSRKASIKDARKSKKRTEHNLLQKKAFKKEEKKIDVLVAEKNATELRKQFNVMVSHFDKAAAKGIIHRNKAARKKAQLAKTLAKLSVTA
ncbi:MAG: 30S ribosomal protein S20 [Candidatus Omnitrophica bacterium]|nr:30S ribosomal protein S20 [Candidatus Omnitrophota bacterium]